MPLRADGAGDAEAVEGFVEGALKGVAEDGAAD